MKTSDLQYNYPEELVATAPQRPSRVLRMSEDSADPTEISFADFLRSIPAGDMLILNNTKVLKRRVFAGDLEILFLSSDDRTEWDVLFPSKKFALGHEFELPFGVRMKLVQKGRPQKVQVSEALSEEYFDKVGELPLPPYIQKAREQRHTVSGDESWYQTAWAKKAGSFAAPTASLHFSADDLIALRERGVLVEEITLHVGLGTFLPVVAENLDDHEMHEEFFEIGKDVWQKTLATKGQGQKIWALGTTVTRSLESMPGDFFSKNPEAQHYSGSTKLLIQPGYKFKIVDRLLTNFHQPESTLLALVAAFAGLEKVKLAYSFAIKNKFRLFSYGDLSVWIKN